MRGHFIVGALRICSVFLCFQFIAAERNAQEEAICQPFLTSPSSSPLLPNLKRNLKYDEDGEFACELVLQDPHLPLQIRGTVHEGLGLLAIRHIQLGLRRQRTALRHFKILSELAPTSADFAYRVGNLYLDSVVSEPAAAVPYFHSILYGQASNDSTLQNLDAMTSWRYLYGVRRRYIKALGQAGRADAAAAELALLLKEHPLDLEAAQLLRSISSAVNDPTDTCDVTPDIGSCNEGSRSNDIELLKYSKALYDLVAAADDGLVDYTGFRIPQREKDNLNSWQPQRFNALPSAEVFEEFSARREPFVVSFGSSAELDRQLHWKTEKWNADGGFKYMSSMMDKDDELLVESKIVDVVSTVAIEAMESTRDGSLQQQQQKQKAAESFGWGINVRRRIMPFSSVLKSGFESSEVVPLHDDPSLNGTMRSSLYVNIQIGMPKHRSAADQDNRSHSSSYSSSDSSISSVGSEASSGSRLLYSAPLHRFKEDIPPPLEFFGNSVWSNMSDINLWMGHARDSDSQSRLHFDATDNLYVVLHGSKLFTLLSPDQVRSAGTLSPTFAVFKDGLSFQFDLQRFAAYVQSRCNENSGATSSITTATTVSTTTTTDVQNNNPNSTEDKSESLLLKFCDLIHNVEANWTKIVSSSDLFADSFRIKLAQVLGSQIASDYDKGNFHFASLNTSQPTDAADNEELTMNTSYVDLQAGDLLYLPAGWLHQVTSKSGFHSAINYWWKPLHWREAMNFEHVKREELHGRLLQRLLAEEVDTSDS